MDLRESGRKRPRQSPASEHGDVVVADEDFISQMPNEILHMVQGLVSVKEIARTSVLSKRWLHAWRTYPDRDLAAVMKEHVTRIPVREWKRRGSLDHTLYEGVRTRVMDEYIKPFMVHHEPNSRVRKFTFYGFLSLTFMCKCIRWLVDARVQILHLEIPLGTFFSMPSAFYKCHSLHELKLWCLPHSSSLGGSGRANPNNIPSIGFDLERLTRALNLKSLRVLVLSRVKFIGDPRLVEDYFTTKYFPHLMEMEMIGCEGVINFNINCQRLEMLKLVLLNPLVLNISGDAIKKLLVLGCFTMSTLGPRVSVSTPNVEVIEWCRSEIPKDLVFENWRSMRSVSEVSIHFDFLNLEIQHCLAGAKTLVSLLPLTDKAYLNFDILKVFSNFERTGPALQLPKYKLTALSIHTGFSKSDILGVSCILKNCHQLQYLDLLVDIYRRTAVNNWGVPDMDDQNMSETEYWESQADNGLSWSLNSLKELNVTLVGQNIPFGVANFIRFLAKHAKSMEKCSMFYNLFYGQPLERLMILDARHLARLANVPPFPE